MSVWQFCASLLKRTRKGFACMITSVSLGWEIELWLAWRATVCKVVSVHWPASRFCSGCCFVTVGQRKLLVQLRRRFPQSRMLARVLRKMLGKLNGWLRTKQDVVKAMQREHCKLFWNVVGRRDTPTHRFFASLETSQRCGSTKAADSSLKRRIAILVSRVSASRVFTCFDRLWYG
mmetsp:Transcript_22514/g.67518  ORF Transcript_22514/g.67518 Transcript_22514/m.67518 type:complete len:176 (-) Transcript_22514:22-549(-)